MPQPPDNRSTGEIMSERTQPPFRADHVGSFLRPAKLKDARKRSQSNAIGAAELKQIEDEAIRDIVKMQEDLGFRVVTDGEFRRNQWHLDFIQQIANVKVVEAQIKVHFHTHEGDIEVAPPGIKVVGKVGRPHGIFVEHFKQLKAMAHVTPKMTIPSPSILHFRGGRDAIDKTAYPDMEDFYTDLARVYSEEVRDLAAAGCRYLQIDETNFAYLCDPALREQVRNNIHEDPDKLPHVYAKLLNGALAGKPADMTACIHICRGNNQSAWVAEGGYDPVAEVLFNEVGVTGFFLEYDDERSGGFAPLRFMPKGKVAVLGLVTTKAGKLETKDEIKRRIDEAAKFLPLEQLALSPQCGFSSTIEGNKLTVEQEIAKLKLVIDVARDVWGSV
jgi:5-methyltetrahydropteroyltriglutamate--homocysteine methyltransferase